ncbi:MAG: FAD-binding protein [Phycisphaerales bacterium]|nr:FAD-binding protein [Phycisphaerales bacterium]MCB9836448.1 FAD-binding protein [Phycisphaera sp.]
MASLPAFTPDQYESLRIRRRDIAEGLASAVSGRVRFGRHDRQLYATDASIYQVEPLGVVVPDSIEDAQRALAYCAGHGIPVLPRGGGTSLAGQCTSEAVVLDLSACCDTIREIAAEKRACTADAGITIDVLNRALAETGLFFAPDPATVRQATVGGCIGNNAAGTRSVKYGRTSENVIAVDALLAGGTRVRFEEGAALNDPVARRLTDGVVDVVRRHERLIRERFPKTLRRNAGYGLDMLLAQMQSGDPLRSVNLAKLLCGSEGTLALTLSAKLLLHPIPRHRGLCVLSFSSLDEAIECVPSLLKLAPSAVELLDDMIVQTALANLEHRAALEYLPRPKSGELMAVLYVEFEASDASVFEEKHAEVRSSVPGASTELYTTPETIACALRLRQAGEPLLHSIPGRRKPLGFIEDNVVPVEHLGEFVRELRKIIERFGTRAAFYAHASVGVLHVRPLLDLRDDSDKKAMIEIAKEAADLAGRLGGVMSGEHGDGKARGPLLERHFGPELMDAFRAVKALFDPENLLNPGNIVEPGPIPSIAKHTRTEPKGEQVSIPDVETFYTFDDQGGLGHAVELCNGAGVCRKQVGGTMCPSYMALKDERHATRGRANALRIALSGQATGQALDWNDAETVETLDLCLSCKGCKRECPSNVDVARLKSEYTAQRYRQHGTPIMARAMASIRTLYKLGSMTPGLAAKAGRPGLVRNVINRAMRFPIERSLPVPVRSLGRDDAWKQTSDLDLPTVLLLGDCFTMFTEPGIGLDAKVLLEAFGYRVRLADVGCCQRPAISTGLLPSAIRHIDKVVPRLVAQIEEANAQAVLVLEPSCLSAIKDDWLGLRCQSSIEDRKRLASMSVLVEQFLESRWDRHPRTPDFSETPGRVLFHGHCHQKALWGSESSTALLARAFGDRVRSLDTGCCGMAGSFGLHEKRYDLSMKIGELVLFPAVREREQGDVVVATGTSCRHQILDGVQVEAVHPVTLLRRHLVWRSETDHSGLAPIFARG